MRISFSWTLASQVILKVDMFRRLCSQNLFSESSPPILKTPHDQIITTSAPFTLQQVSCRFKKRQTGYDPQAGSCNFIKNKPSPDFIPGLKDKKQGHMVGEPRACKVSVNEAQALALVDKRLREARSRRNGTYSIAHTKTTKTNNYILNSEVCSLKSELKEYYNAYLKMQPMIIIFPRRGSMGSRARMRPRGVNSSLQSKASSSEKHFASLGLFEKYSSHMNTSPSCGKLI